MRKEKEDIVENDQELEVKDENKDTRKIKFPEKAVSIIKKARKKNELKDRKKYYRDMKTSDLPEEIEKLNADLKDLDKQSKHIQNQKMSYGIQVSALMELKKKPKIFELLKYNSYWLKDLNRDPNNVRAFLSSMKVKYRMRATDKVSDAIDNIDIISNVLNALK